MFKNFQIIIGTYQDHYTDPWQPLRENAFTQASVVSNHQQLQMVIAGMKCAGDTCGGSFDIVAYNDDCTVAFNFSENTEELPVHLFAESFWEWAKTKPAFRTKQPTNQQKRYEAILHLLSTCNSAEEADKLYLHYKGGIYRVLHQAEMEWNAVAAYVYEDVAEGGIYVRPRAEFGQEPHRGAGFTRFTNIRRALAENTAVELARSGRISRHDNRLMALCQMIDEVGDDFTKLRNYSIEEI